MSLVRRTVTCLDLLALMALPVYVNHLPGVGYRLRAGWRGERRCELPLSVVFDEHVSGFPFDAKLECWIDDEIVFHAVSNPTAATCNRIFAVMVAAGALAFIA